MKPYTAWAVVGAVALDAAAQATTAHPADATAAVPPATYRSAFQGYVPYREQELALWRALNDEAARIGGHLGIFRPSRGMSRAQPTAPDEPSRHTGQEPVRSEPSTAPPGDARQRGASR